MRDDAAPGPSTLASVPKAPGRLGREDARTPNPGHQQSYNWAHATNASQRDRHRVRHVWGCRSAPQPCPAGPPDMAAALSGNPKRVVLDVDPVGSRSWHAPNCMTAGGPDSESLHLRVLGGGVPSALKPASRGPAP